jgi:hypothetical protein
MNDQERPAERRASPRVDARLPARLHVGDDVIDAQTIDISRDAVLIGGEDLPPASRVHIEIDLAELGWHRLAADVVRRQEVGPDGARMAATFAGAASSGGRDAIAEFVRRHLG